MKINCISSADPLLLKEKTALLRVDYNVPVHEGEILDDTRIFCTIPTIQHLRKHGIKVRILTHFGRPKGQNIPELSTQFLVKPLSKFLGETVSFSKDFSPSEDNIVLYENLRFDPGEEKNDPEFAKKLSLLGDLFINDAFSVSHRAHASTVGVAEHLPSFMGQHLEKEWSSYQSLQEPQKPYVGIIGGAKVSTKLPVLKNLLSKLDSCFVGGGMANTFLAAQDIYVADSLVEESMIPTAKELLKKHTNIMLPEDVVVTKDVQVPTDVRMCPINDIQEGEKIVDIGMITIQKIHEKLNEAETIVWNGPLGVFEIPPFDNGTLSIMKVLGAISQSRPMHSIAGGGETVAAAKASGVEEQLYFLSTAGGAFLEFLSGKTLPGIKALC